MPIQTIQSLLSKRQTKKPLTGIQALERLQAIRQAISELTAEQERIRSAIIREEMQEEEGKLEQDKQEVQRQIEACVQENSVEYCKASIFEVARGKRRLELEGLKEEDWLKPYRKEFAVRLAFSIS